MKLFVGRINRRSCSSGFVACRAVRRGTDFEFLPKQIEQRESGHGASPAPCYRQIQHQRRIYMHDQILPVALPLQ